MTPCDQFQNQLLEHLYGLLEPGETQALTDHLASCPDCTRALARAQEQKQLLAAAAKVGFPDVRFEAPVERSTLPVASVARRSWGRWAVAALVFLAVGGVAAPFAISRVGERRVLLAKKHLDQLLAQDEQVSKETAARVSGNDLEISAVREEMARLENMRQQRLAAASAAIAAKPLHMSITGPAAAEAGAAGRYQVRLADSDNNVVRANVTAQVVDQRKQRVATALRVQGQADGTYRIELPRDLPLKPDSDLLLEVNAVTAGGDRKEQEPPPAVTEKLPLIAPLYLTYLMTDKPMYQPGETVYFRSVSLERFTFKPPPVDLGLVYAMKNPRGEQEQILQCAARAAGKDATILGPDNQPIRGVGAGEYAIPQEAPGGEYVLSVRETNARFPPQERKFIVNRYERPRLNKELEFTRKAFGPGEEVVAACRVSRAEGGRPVAEKPVTAAVQVDAVACGADGKPGGPWELRTDAQGGVSVRFRLPERLERGEASLALTFRDDANVETLVRTVPVSLKKLVVEFFPEGGDLVAGLPNRVYFQARTTLDKPAELKGRIVDSAGQVAVEIQTFNDPVHPEANQGMGRFEFSPRAGETYQLKIDSPPGVEGRHVLPPVKDDGVTLTVQPGVIADSDPIRLTLRSARAERRLLVGAYCRGRLMAHESVGVGAGQPVDLSLQPEAGVGGVYRITVYEKPGDAKAGAREILRPLAERLVYRSPAHRLKLSLRADKPHYVPGERSTLHIQARDERGKPASAILGLAVVDKSVIKLADEKTFRGLPVHFLLTTEIRRPEDLEHADFLLDDHPSAPLALDLLLGTQGWRRFAEQDPDVFRRRQRTDAEQFLVNAGQISAATLAPPITEFDAQAVQKVEEEFGPPLAKLQARLVNAQRRQVELRAEEPRVRDQEKRLTDELSAAYAKYEAELRHTEDSQQLLSSLVLIALAALAVASFSGAPWWLLRRRPAWAVTFLLVGSCCLVLLMTLGGVYRTVHETQELRDRTLAANLAIGAEHDRNMNLEKQLDEAAQQLDPHAGPAAAPEMPRGAPGAALAGADHRPRTAARRAAAVNAPLAAPGGQPPGPALANIPPAPAGPLGRAIGKDKQGEMLPRLDMAGNIRQPKGAVMNRQAKAEFAQKKAAIVDDDLKQVVRNRDAVARGAGRRIVFGPAYAKRPFEKGAMQLDIAGEVAAMRPIEQVAAPFVVREYAHVHTHGEGSFRSDFAETLYWNPVLVLADKGADVSFDLSDSVTTFQVLGFGHTPDGRLGTLTFDLESRPPLSLEPKLPTEVTASDTIEVPLSIANATDQPRSFRLRMEPSGLQVLGGQRSEEVQLPADGRVRRLFRLRPQVLEGEAQLRFDGEGEAFSDRLLRSIRVVPGGFPIGETHSGLLEGSAALQCTLPPTSIAGTLKYQVSVYPSTLADLQKGLEALLREPGGCFEQTSTANYPNLLILDYLKETDQARPELARRAQELLARGYNQLTSFECSDPASNRRQGYEWFGGTAPPHEALTAYGLLEFRDMARVYEVDKAMLERTKNYLMSRRDGKGGFSRNSRALDSFGRAPDNVTNAYIVWALTESGQDDDVTRELDALAHEAESSKDPYFLALVANSLLNRRRHEEAYRILDRLTKLQKDDGHLDAAQTSITGSGGRDLQIETTSLALLAWLKAGRLDRFHPNIQSAVQWITEQRGGYGGFGSTQSTILALKALIAYARANKKTPEAGDLAVFLGDRELTRQHFEAGVQDAIVLDVKDAEKLLKPGKNPLRVELSGKNAFPFSAAWTCRTLQPAPASGCPIALAARLDRTQADEGSAVQLEVTVENKSSKGQAMTVAILGLPGGLTLPEDMKQLKDLARPRTDGPSVISAWEIRGRELVLYWRGLAPNQKIRVPIDLVCRVPGKYRGPASRAYLYYDSDQKSWIEPLGIAIKAR